MFEGAILTVRYFFDAFNTKYTADLLFRGVDACGDIGKMPDALPQAFAAGRNSFRTCGGAFDAEGRRDR